MTETKVQLNIRRKLESQGWTVIRLAHAPTSISATGTPDLLALKPSGKGAFLVKFVEVKTPEGNTSKLQKYHIRKLKEAGFPVLVLTTEKDL